MERSLVPDVASTYSDSGASPRVTPVRPRTNTRSCRVCGSSRLIPYLDLGKQALANALDSTRRYPLAVVACAQCKLSQLTYVVPKETLYTQYAFSSGVSAGWRQHCAELAEEFAQPGALMVDVAANDGTCVNAFMKAGCATLGIEPSASFGGPTGQWVTAFWTRELVADERLEGKVDVLTAQNVLGHVADVHDFMAGIALALAPTGVAVIEVPYVCDLLTDLAFDTIYHEHLSYWSVTALKELCAQHGLVLRDVRPLAVHGGSIRAIIGTGGTPTQAVTRYLVREIHDLQRSTYMQFSSRVTRRLAEISAELTSAAPYVGFGAPAKASTLLGCLDVRAYPSVVYDETLAKQGHRIAGTRVPIEAPPEDWSTEPGPVCIFPWVWSDGVVRKLRDSGYAGRIFVPLPKPRWID